MVDLRQIKKEPLQGDLKEAKYFLSLFKGKHLIIPRNKNQWHKPRTQQAFEEYLDEWLQQSLDIQFMVNESTGRADTDITQIRAIWADLDTGKEMPKWPIPPSAIVESSPGKWHVYWFTNPQGKPSEKKTEWKGVLTRLVLDYGADPGAVSLSRVLRVPGTYNFSGKYKKPQRVKLIEATGTVYHWTEILKHFPPELASLEIEKEQVVSSGFDEQVQFQRFVTGESINEPMMRYIASLAWYASKTKIKKHIGVWFDAVPPEVMAEHKERYKDSYQQIDKTIEAKIIFAKKKQQEQNVVVLAKSVKAKALEEDLQIEHYPIPEECVPKTALNAAKVINEFNNNGLEPAILSVFIAASSLLNKNVLIHQIDDSLTTFSSIGVIVAMKSGTRKTQTFKELAMSSYKYEQELQGLWEAEKNLRKTKTTGLQSDIKKLFAKASSGEKSDIEKDNIYQQIAKKEDKIEELTVPMPSLIIKDITEEAVLPIMKDNNGTISILADDARNVIKNILGKQAKGDNTSEAWMIDCFGGVRVQSNRVKFEGKPLSVDFPCLNVLMFVQPDMAIKLKNSEMYQVSGLAARLPIYFYPVDELQMLRKTDMTKTLDRTKLAGYLEMMEQLQIQRSDNPLVVRLSPGAKEVCNELNKWFIEKLTSIWIGDYEKLNKLVTQSVIYATIIAALDDEDFRMKLTLTEKNFEYELSTVYMNMGVMFIKALYEGMQLSTVSLDNTKIINIAYAFAKSLLKHYKSKKMYEGFAMNSYLYQAFGMLDKLTYHDVIRLLVDKGWLIPTECTTNRELNMGFPSGVVKQGEMIYQLNIEEVEAQLMKAETRRREIETIERGLSNG